MVSVKGEPLNMPDALMRPLRALAAQDGLMRPLDLTRNSYHFAGRPGDLVRFNPATPLAGLIGRISDISKLDDTGEVRTWVHMFGADREIHVSYRDLGHVPVIAASAA